MKRIDSKLIETSKIIDEKFDKSTNDNREEISTDILAHIRNFCEVVMYKVFNEENNTDLYQTHENLKTVRKYIKQNYFEIDKFHTMLDASVGHMAFGKMQSEALLLKYIPKLIVLKKLLLDKYNISILENINKYPLDLDESLTSFYEKILFVLLNSNTYVNNLSRNQYFVRKRSMKYINGYVFYEYVFDVSDDKVSKFNTFVCYSLKYIRFDYDLKFILSKREITFFNTKVHINIIHDYEYSIRPCTFKNLLYLINYNLENGKRDKDYKIIMETIKKQNMSLLDIVDNNFEIKLSQDGFYQRFFRLLNKFLSKNSLGKNIIRFLLLEMRNSIIKEQFYYPKSNEDFFNEKFNNLRINLGSKSFELMPFAFNPKGAKPSLYTLLYLFDVSSHKDELLYRNICEYINHNNTLFVNPIDIGYTKEIFDKCINEFNTKIDFILQYHLEEKIFKISNYLTIESYFKNTCYIIIVSKHLCQSANVYMYTDYSKNTFLTSQQKSILENLFKSSSIELITGSAGTGKTTMIKAFINNNCDRKILCLTTTNTANNNLKTKAFNSNVTYMNIAQFENDKYPDNYEIVIIDEASFVPTKSFLKIILKFRNSAILAVGDPNQLESIEFGNWFSLLLHFLKEYNVVHVLEKELRTDIQELTKVWEIVRDGGKDKTLELLSSYDMTSKLNNDIFNISEGEIILCLNYDGLYGINNINRYLQALNPNKTFEYQQNLYKVNDPIIFITNDYNNHGIYNNLKGKIKDILETDDEIMFKVELFDVNIRQGNPSYELQIECDGDKYFAIVRKSKFYTEKYDNDMDTRTKLPFQISYAMSIHKAQGLEFDSVKLIITKETDELISKNIFYTAITRTKRNLKIYWEPEVANFVLDNIEKEANAKKVDLSLLFQELKKTC